MKTFLLSVLMLLGMSAINNEAVAQFYAYDKDGNLIYRMDKSMPAYINFEKPGTGQVPQFYVYDEEGKELYGMENGMPAYVDFKIVEEEHDWVDLGLSVKWAKYNIGATKAVDYGEHYAWAEVTPKNDYAWSTYKIVAFGYADLYGINKYQVEDDVRGGRWYDYDKGSLFIGDGKRELETNDDAASVHWGGDWKTPTEEDWRELYDQCDAKWVTNYNNTNVNGYLITSKKQDYENASIFLPAAGYYDGKELKDGGSNGQYWMSELRDDKSYTGGNTYFNSDVFVPSDFDRKYGLTIRAICVVDENGNTNKNHHEAVDLGLTSGNLWATCNIGALSAEKSGNYYAWGETATKSDYTWGTYKYMLKDGTTWHDISKYTFDDHLNMKTVWYDNNTTQFKGDEKTTLEAIDDVAALQWGPDWRMPTAAEWEDLIENTKQEWVTNYEGTGINGYLLTSTKKGYEDKSIFLPAAGMAHSTVIDFKGSEGCYWSSSLDNEYTYLSKSIFFDSETFKSSEGLRMCGFSVRPVYVGKDE